jgi:hypothetical protein
MTNPAFMVKIAWSMIILLQVIALELTIHVWGVPDGRITLIEDDGTPLGVQFNGLFQSVDTLPFHVFGPVDS